MTQQLYNTVSSLQPVQPAAPTLSAPLPSGAPDPQLVYSDPAAWQAQYDAHTRRQFENTLAQAAQPMFVNNAEMAKFASRTDTANADVWTKYGPEIEAAVSAIPVQARSKALYDQAAELIRGRHVNEIAREMAEKMNAQTGDGSVPGGGSSFHAAESVQDPIDKLFSENHPWAVNARLDGIDARKAREHGKRMGHTAEAYAQMIRNSNVVRSR